MMYMCGIIGYVGQKNCLPVLLEGLSKLEYRGYDSAGVAMMESGKIVVCKERGRLANLQDVLRHKKTTNATVGIGHTRWATHGKPSRENAHPHSSPNGKFAVVHNGIIENDATLRAELIAKGYTFRSETDSEVIAVLLQENDTGNVLETMQKTAAQLRGAFAVGILCNTQPNTLFCARFANPLIIGVGEAENLIASDIAPLLPFAKKVYHLADGEFAAVTATCIQIFDAHLQPLHKQETEVHWRVETVGKGNYDHYMLKEIMEQPDAVRATVNAYVQGERIAFPMLHLAGDTVRRLQRVYIVGCGSAYHAGLVGKYALESLLHIPVEVVYASEFRYRTLVLEQNVLCVFISQSGETADTLAALRAAKAAGAPTVSIVNVKGSTIAQESQSVLYTHAGPEIAVATTKAYATQLAVFYMLGLYFAEQMQTIDSAQYHEYFHALLELPKQIQATLCLASNINKMAQRFAQASDVYYIGRNLDYAVALEAALKLKEISYIHAEAYPAGELKHGSIALIEPGTPVVCMMCDERMLEKTGANMKEVRARGAEVLAITTETCAKRICVECTQLIAVPTCCPLYSASVSVIPMQLLSYYTAQARGCDIDKPRNLAKSVTVE